MVSESLMLTFNLLTGYYSRQQPYSFWLGDIIFLGMECVEVKRFLCFYEDDSRIYAKIFSGFMRKHLIITTHNEKQCTRALRKKPISAHCTGLKTLRLNFLLWR